MRLPRIIAALLIGGLLVGLTGATASAAPVAASVNVATARSVLAAAAEPGKYPDGRRFKHGPWHKVKGYKPGSGDGIDLPNVRWDVECTAAVRWYVEEKNAGDGTDAGAGVNGRGEWHIQVANGKCDKGGGKEILGGGGKEYKSEYAFSGKRYQTGVGPVGCAATSYGSDATKGAAADTSSMWRTKWTFSGTTRNYSACTPEDMTVQIYRRDAGSDDFYMGWFDTTVYDVTKLGAPIEIPKDEVPPYDPNNVCPFGTPIKAESREGPHNVLGANWRVVRPKVTFSAPQGATGAWDGRLFFRRTTGTEAERAVTFTSMFGGSTPAIMAGQLEKEYTAYAQTTTTDRTAKPVEIVGMQLFVGSPSLVQSPNGNLAPGTNARTATGSFGYGVTNPPACRFWFGPKVFEDPTSSVDEPQGGDGTDPAPTTPAWDPEDTPPPAEEPDTPSEDEQCTFKWSDPTTWLEGGICALVAVGMRMIGLLDTLANLVAALPKWLVLLVATAVTGWFVFRNDFMAGQNDKLSDDWNNSGPGKVFSDVGDIAAQQKTASGCKGPSIPVNTPMYKATWTPLDSCSGPAATIAGVSRAALAASAYIGAFLTFIRLVGASLGLNLNAFGRRDE